MTESKKPGVRSYGDDFKSIWKYLRPRLLRPMNIFRILLVLFFITVLIWSRVDPKYFNSLSDNSSTATTTFVQSTTTTTLLPIPSSDITGYHNGIPEAAYPGESELNSSCTDVTSYDYDWNDDVLCTRKDGSEFYTNYAGGRTADTSF